MSSTSTTTTTSSTTAAVSAVRQARIPLSRILAPPTIAREANDELVESVRQHGVLQAPAVQPNGLGKFLVVYGTRRFDAARKAGLADIVCTVLPPSMSPDEIRVLTLVENVQREGQAPHVEGQLLGELQGLGLAIETIAKRVGKPRAWVASRIALCSLAPEVLELLDDGLDYNPTCAARIASLPEERQREIVESHPHVLVDCSALDDVLARGPSLSGVPFAADCEPCPTRNGTSCLVPSCFAEKSAASRLAAIGNVRQLPSHRNAPVVFQPGTIDHATVRQHRAVPIRAGQRIAEHDEPGAEPAVLLSPSSARPVYLVAAPPPKPDGRRATGEERAARSVELAAASTLLARLRSIIDGAVEVSPDLSAFVVLLAAVDGADSLAVPDAYRALVRLAYPHLQQQLTNPSKRAAAVPRLKKILGVG